MKQNITTQFQSILKTFLSHVSKRALRLPKRLFVISILVAVVGLLYYFLITAPASFPDESIIRVESGAPLKEISDLLEEKSVVRSAVVFQFFAIFLKKRFLSFLWPPDYHAVIINSRLLK